MIIAFDCFPNVQLVLHQKSQSAFFRKEEEFDYFRSLSLGTLGNHLSCFGLTSPLTHKVCTYKGKPIFSYLQAGQQNQSKHNWRTIWIQLLPARLYLLPLGL